MGYVTAGVAAGGGMGYMVVGGGVEFVLSGRMR